MLHDWATANRATPVQHSKPPPRQRWSPPSQGSLKCNITTYSFLVEGLTGIGICIRDHQGAFIRARSTTIKGSMEPHVGKAFAFLHGINWTHNQNLENIIFETDCKRIPPISPITTPLTHLNLVASLTNVSLLWQTPQTLM
uniref:RNase H type-1 domain-containing protein n=1 Tax=Cajanus cajan TaxID=3821 RepID=A0A151QLB8_CAJCA|nr:hypothetical protein KK1_049065 [Cajanus cajan]